MGSFRTSQRSSGKGNSLVYAELGFGTTIMEHLSFARSLGTRLVLSEHPLDKALQPCSRSVLVHVQRVTLICQHAQVATIHTQLLSIVNAPQGTRLR